MNEITDAQLQPSFDRDAIRNAILRLADVVDGSTGYDPADNPEAAAAALALAALLSEIDSHIATEGIQSALSMLWRRWALT